MKRLPDEKLILATTAAFVLWGVTWLPLLFPDALLSLLGISPVRWVEIALGALPVFFIGWLLSCCSLCAFYRLVERLHLPFRALAELLFVLLPGFCMMLICALPASSEWLWGNWIFFSTPAFYTVLCLRGWEWYRWRKMGQG